MHTRKQTAIALSLVWLIGLVASAAGQTKQPIPIPNSPTEMSFSGLRGVIYCEVWLFNGSPDTGIAGVYFNTSNLNNAANKSVTCPAGMWNKLTVPSLEAKYAVIGAYKNGPRGWTMDRIKIPAGPIVTFDGIQTRWWGEGRLPKGAQLKVAHMEPFQELKSHRKSSMYFDKGKPVFILDDPEGTPWVMQAFGQIIDPSLTYDALKDLGSKLKLPKGWKYRVVMLDKELIISTPQGYNWIVQDELQNTYDACKDGACNFEP
jgi:hypothetical protein